jgi:hypothetical protein
MGVTIGSVIGITILGFFVLLAVYNLFHWTAVIPSMLWLALMGAVFGGFLKTKGPRQMAVDTLGEFVLQQIAWTTGSPGGELHVGYRIFGRSFSYFKIPLEKVEIVKWNTGQASSQAGRDVGDWSVAVWFRHADPIKTKQRKSRFNVDKDLHIVGPLDNKDRIATFGRALVAFLQEAGVPLAQEKDDCTFVRRTTINPSSPPDSPPP